MPTGSSPIFIVEHLDPELGAWSALEYKNIAAESKNAGVGFFLSSVPSDLELPEELKVGSAPVQTKTASVEELYSGEAKKTVCLLDPAAKTDLEPADGDRFDVFLFGGILGT
jgi:ribosome biogenesis SPOUT family RNA methylase Rps3